MSEVQLITEPRVYVLARPALDRGELARFLADTGFPGWATEGDRDAQVLTEVAARVCYRSFARGRPHRDHLAHLLSSGHLSTFEHAQWTLLITGVSRSLTHELVRHRHLSYSQESQRFVDASNVAFVVPPALLKRQAEYERWKTAGGPHCREWCDWVRACTQAAGAYRDLLPQLERNDYGGRAPGYKSAREAARAVLPNCVETRIAVSGNARAWREVLARRLDPAADAEFRRLASAVLVALSHEAPDLFAGLLPLLDPDQYARTTP